MRIWQAGAVAGLVLASSAARAETALETLAIKPVVLEQTSVSGISSGAFMAVQFAVANAGYVAAVGAEAGGPYFCAGDGWALMRTSADILGGTGECMQNGRPDVARSLDKARAVLGAAEREKLRAQKAWLYSGSNDRTVDRSVVDGLRAFLEGMGVQDIAYDKGAAAHGHLVDLPGGSPAACSDQKTVARDEYFADCGVDGAYRVLERAYGTPAGRKAAADPARLFEFVQDGHDSARMAKTGYVYVPQICDRESCRVHVAFHGCLQGETIGDHFARRSGYSEWAEAFRAVILFPRIGTGDSLNPNGCWDWWGYTDPSYRAIATIPFQPLFWSDGTYVTKEAPQIKAVDTMIRKLVKAGS